MVARQIVLTAFSSISRCGFYSWKGVVHVAGRAIYGGSPPEYRTVHEAQVEAVSWAMGYGSTSLFIEGDDYRKLVDGHR